MLDKVRSRARQLTGARKGTQIRRPVPAVHPGRPTAPATLTVVRDSVHEPPR